MRKIRGIKISEARPRLTQLIDDVNAGGEPYFIIANSQVKAVLLGINQFNDMVEQLEDLADAAELLEAQLAKEPTINLEEHLQKLKSRGAGVQA